MSDETVYATSVKDSSGKEVEKPVFKEGNEEFDAQLLKYNFKTKKALIDYVRTKQNDGYLLGDTTKRQADGHIDLKSGKFTTCDAEHPHFYIGLTKAEAIPGDKIVSGPAYLVVADIPLPIAIPFGFFPNTSKNNASGILIPKVGEEQTRGFFLQDGGYYFAINDYMCAQVLGTIYSKLSWSLNATANYRVRYEFAGNFGFDYAVNITGEQYTPSYLKTKDYRITWNHSQDSKANPNSRFSASVNVSSTSYDQNVGYNLDDHLTNTKSSSISYSYTWTGSSFTGSFNQSQSSIDKSIDLDLPSLSYNVNPIYPFRRKEMTGEPKWYENIQISYSASLDNKIHSSDSLLFTKHGLDNVNNGFQQSIPLSTNFKLASFITLTPSLNYKGVMYSSRIREIWDSKKQKIDTLTYHGLNDSSYAQGYYPAVSLGITPKFFGMYQFQNSKIKALRHVFSPSITISFIPDVRKFVPNYYFTVIDSTPNKNIKNYQYKKIVYSEFQNGMYGTPVGYGKSGTINLALNNNFEMKWASETDSGVTEKKITLLRELNFSTSYNIFADSMNLAPIRMVAGTSVFNNKLNIDFNATLDPYMVDSNSNKYYDINKFALSKNRGLGRITSATLTIGTSFKSGAGKNTTSDNKQTDQTNTNPSNMPNTSSTQNVNKAVDFSIPWSLSINYSWGFSKPYLYDHSVVQTVDLSGDLSLTKKWKISIKSGFDIQHNNISPTQLSIHRDLHCWTMSFQWTPLGPWRSYTFTINALAPILQDLKYNKTKSWYDNNN
jgi:hypothetical protein